MMWYNIFYILHDNLYSVLWARSGRMRGGSILGLGLRLSLGLVRVIRGLGLYTWTNMKYMRYIAIFFFNGEMGRGGGNSFL